jgi:hypothetical protein
MFIDDLIDVELVDERITLDGIVREQILEGSGDRIVHFWIERGKGGRRLGRRG